MFHPQYPPLTPFHIGAFRILPKDPFTSNYLTHPSIKTLAENSIARQPPSSFFYSRPCRRSYQCLFLATRFHSAAIHYSRLVSPLSSPKSILGPQRCLRPLVEPRPPPWKLRYEHWESSSMCTHMARAYRDHEGCINHF